MHVCFQPGFQSSVAFARQHDAWGTTPGLTGLLVQPVPLTFPHCLHWPTIWYASHFYIRCHSHYSHDCILMNSSWTCFTELTRRVPSNQCVCNSGQFLSDAPGPAHSPAAPPLALTRLHCPANDFTVAWSRTWTTPWEFSPQINVRLSHKTRI